MAKWFEITEAPLRVDARGHWWHGDEPLRGKIADLFGRNIEVTPDGGYNVRLGRNVATLRVDDTPFLVRRMELIADADGLQQVRLHTSDAADEVLDATTLVQSPSNVLYCTLRRGSYAVPCRFMPEHYHTLALHMEERGGAYVLPMAGAVYAVAACAAGKIAPVQRWADA